VRSASGSASSSTPIISAPAARAAMCTAVLQGPHSSSARHQLLHKSTHALRHPTDSGRPLRLYHTGAGVDEQGRRWAALQGATTLCAHPAAALRITALRCCLQASIRHARCTWCTAAHLPMHSCAFRSMPKSNSVRTVSTWFDSVAQCSADLPVRSCEQAQGRQWMQVPVSILTGTLCRTF
jgi:hypothetical protein